MQVFDRILDSYDVVVLFSLMMSIIAAWWNSYLNGWPGDKHLTHSSDRQSLQGGSGDPMTLVRGISVGITALQSNKRRAAERC